MSRPDLLFLLDVPRRIWMREWAPGSKAEAVRCSLGEGLVGFVWVAPAEWGSLHQNLAAGLRLACSHLRVLVEAPSVSTALRAAFEAYNPVFVPEAEMASFLDDVYARVVRALNRVLSFVGREIGQWKVREVESAAAGTFFVECDARWSWDGRTWHPLRRPGTQPSVIEGWGRAEVGRDDWTRIQDFLDVDGDVEITRTVAANAQYLASVGDLRAATLEAAICLERELRLLVGQFLNDRGLPKEPILGSQRSGSALASVWLPLIRPSTDPRERRAATKVFDLRNQLLHNAQPRVSETHGGDIHLAAALARALCAECLSRDDPSSQDSHA